jgi:hypothetical protein
MMWLARTSHRLRNKIGKLKSLSKIWELKKGGRSNLIEIMTASSRWSSMRSKLTAEIKSGERSTLLD